MKGNMGTKTQRKVYATTTKAKVAVVAIREGNMVNEIASLYGVHFTP